MKRDEVSRKELYSVDKVVIFPFCITSCLDHSYKGLYKCDDKCSDCQIGELRPEIEERGYKIWIAGSDDSVSNLLKDFYENSHKLTSLGVSCRLSKTRLEKHLENMDFERIFKAYDHYAIPKICVNIKDEYTTKKISTKAKIDKLKFLDVLKQLEK